MLLIFVLQVQSKVGKVVSGSVTGGCEAVERAVKGEWCERGRGGEGWLVGEECEAADRARFDGHVFQLSYYTEFDRL